MYALIGVGSALAIWTTVLVCVDKRIAWGAQVEIIDALDVEENAQRVDGTAIDTEMFSKAVGKG